MNRDRKRRRVTSFQKFVLNPVARQFAGILPGWVLLETTGRRSGTPRRVPVGGSWEGETFWVVSEHGTKANYVRNIVKDPKVRLRRNGRWRTGKATVVPGDDAKARARTQNAWNRFAVQTFGTDLLSVRIDLDDT